MSSQANTTGVSESQVVAMISLGSNLASRFGSCVETLEMAVENLKPLSSTSLLVSSFYRSEPSNCPPCTPDFVNAVVALQPQAQLTPQSLLGELMLIEVAFGRQRGALPNSARVLDLDLICFGNQQLNDDLLVLPHPRAHLRRFVLEPLAEISPELVLPGQTASVRQLLNQLTGGANVELIST